jgi:PadR family transcriptional regulator, regulatory protein AphA
VDPVPGCNEILLKLFFIREAPPKTAKKLLGNYRERQQALLARDTAISARLPVEYPNNANLQSWLATLSFGSHISRALLEWCDEAEEMLSRRR